MSNRIDVAIDILRRDLYKANPELVPFAYGDRASQLGKESAESFAARKWLESHEDCVAARRLTEGEKLYAARVLLKRAMDLQPVDAAGSFIKSDINDFLLGRRGIQPIATHDEMVR